MKNNNKETEQLKPFNSVIQVCPICKKIDAYKGDNHNCNEEMIRQIESSYLWD